MKNDNKTIQIRGENIMRDMTIKIFLIGLALFVCKAPTLAQNQDIDIRCEVLSTDYNVLGSKALSDFGSFYLFADGKKDEEGLTEIIKYYELPRTKLILNILVGYVSKNESFGNQVIGKQMILGKKRIPLSSDSERYRFFDEATKHAVNIVSAVYSIKAFDEESKGMLSMQFLGKKKPIAIMMKCKKVKKEGK